ncbi:alpha-methylacyl-CoA racemase [Rhizobiales bacterium GAS191]|nr:alpha-methylacyl-CoA racemase [Rhizobiales bacterium GAS188]SED14469.1 alpha-methylacyl-CoA racemase [Rhizobiales bacterium GAS191]
MGPLAGFRVVEFAGIGPGPMCAMLLADMGATVLRLDRPTVSNLGIERPERFNLLNRGRQSAIVDLKRPEGIALALDLVSEADALLEGFRPGTMERLGLGPEPCLGRNPRLVYGRMTGWGQEGPLAAAAGHDMNYIALTGALHAIGRAGQPPTPPLNLIGDYGGGALYLAFGMVCALLEAQKSGEGQVVDAAMIDGAASLMTPFFGLHAAGLHDDRRGENILDSGAPYYDVYACADGRYISVAAIETKFRAEFYSLIGIDAAALPSAAERANWPAIREAIAERIATRPAAEWCAILEGTDACVAPVLSMSEAPHHPHHLARGTFVEIGGIVQPAPAPRFSRTKPDMPTPPQPTGQDTAKALAAWGVAADRIAQLRESGVIGDAKRSE